MPDAPDGRRVPWTNLRLRAFRDVHPNGEISTRIIGEEPLTIVAEVFDEARRMLARGTARHTKNDFAVEDVETSAISRALKFAGYVIDDGDITPREAIDFAAPAAVWPAKFIKGGMVTEIAQQVTQGDLDRARELAAFAWDTFALGDLAELPESDAREKIDAAVELARQEMAEDADIADGPSDTPTIVHIEGDDPGPPEPKAPGFPPAPELPWDSAAAMRRDIKARGISTRAVWNEIQRIASVLGQTGPTGTLDAIYRHPDRRLVAKFGAWVRNHDVVETAP
jgi:hypothetical protein